MLFTLKVVIYIKDASVSYVCERNVCSYVVVFFLKIDVLFVSTGYIMQKYFHAESNVRLTHFEHFHEKILHVEVNRIRKANLKSTCKLTRLLNVDTVRMMSRTNIDCVTPFSC